MTVAPIVSVPVQGGAGSGKASAPGSAASMFESLLKDAIDNVSKTELSFNEETLKIAAGESDSLHALAIHSAKAELALSALVAVRNKALDAYKEIMQISL